MRQTARLAIAPFSKNPMARKRVVDLCRAHRAPLDQVMDFAGQLTSSNGGRRFQARSGNRDPSPEGAQQPVNVIGQSERAFRLGILSLADGFFFGLALLLTQFEIAARARDDREIERRFVARGGHDQPPHNV
jgi:hypothetical protein